MRLAYVALITALLPLIGVHIAYLVAAQHELVPWCIPYLHGCCSISQTGRYAPASYFFRATVIPTAVFMLIYWYLMQAWLLSLGSARDWAVNILPYLGWIASIFLVLYATVLGSDGQFYQLLRRYGITMFFAFTAFAQLLTTYVLSRLRTDLAVLIFRGKLGANLLMLVLGLISIPIMANYKSTEIRDILEWNFALIMVSYIILSFFAWRASDFRVKFSVTTSNNFK